ncbi:hypothetical protein [Thauera phenylacetica]|uniref:hypothetical protein n=1 Tax=Thauera phenylacetica TaxID=164400 RepID=UPI0012F735B5|nr:hypothetical protein [Thauera phenylacetica]
MKGETWVETEKISGWVSCFPITWWISEWGWHGNPKRMQNLNKTRMANKRVNSGSRKRRRFALPLSPAGYAQR